MHRYAISDKDFERIKPLLPGQPGKPGRNAKDNRLFIDAVLWLARTGAPWEDLPERFGKHNTVYKRFSNDGPKKADGRPSSRRSKIPISNGSCSIQRSFAPISTLPVKKKHQRRRGPRTLPRRLLDQAPRCRRCPRQPLRVHSNTGSGWRLPAGRGPLAPLRQRGGQGGAGRQGL